MLGLTRRAATPHDEEFLYQVYASTRMEELAVTGWDVAQKEQFLRSQHSAQHQYYHDVFPAASYELLLWENAPVGRLYIDRRESEVAIIDIALLPQWQRRGIGSFLLKEVMAEAVASEKPVRIYVEKFNPALRWYERLGFQVIGDIGVYLHMEWKAAAPTA